jgi:hypothetical protein
MNYLLSFRCNPNVFFEFYITCSPQESGQKEQEEEQSSTTGGSSEETEDHEKWHKLSAYHNWDQQGCVRFMIWFKEPRFKPGERMLAFCSLFALPISVNPNIPR